MSTLLAGKTRGEKMVATQSPGSAVYTSSISFSHRRREGYQQASPLRLYPTCPAGSCSVRLACIRMGLSQCQEHLKWAEHRHEQAKVLIAPPSELTFHTK